MVFSGFFINRRRPCPTAMSVAATTAGRSETAAGATDADREVLSNINPRGRAPAAAAGDVAAAIERVLREKKSGVIFP